jgi:hypothetical protein
MLRWKGKLDPVLGSQGGGNRNVLKQNLAMLLDLVVRPSRDVDDRHSLCLPFVVILYVEFTHPAFRAGMFLTCWLV